MHLLREGPFSAATTFLSEIAEKRSAISPQERELDSGSNTGGMLLDDDGVPSDEVRKNFATMYWILHELKSKHNLVPAIDWSRDNRGALELRGSNLELQLCQLQYVYISCGKEDQQGPTSDSREEALRYARSVFPLFTDRYFEEIKGLIGAMAFWPNLGNSPYKNKFNNPSAFNDVAQLFTREFCSLLGLSAESPLYVAATAGAIALPTLLKLQTIMKAKRTEWTSQNELPVSYCSFFFFFFFPLL